MWSDGFNRALRGRRSRRIPRWALASLAGVLDVFGRVGVPVPLTWKRFKSMTTDYVTPTEDTILLLGAPPFSLEEGIRQTVEWLDGRLADDG